MYNENRDQLWHKELGCINIKILTKIYERNATNARKEGKNIWRQLEKPKILFIDLSGPIVQSF